jgi:hypothetical protein
MKFCNDGRCSTEASIFIFRKIAAAVVFAFLSVIWMSMVDKVAGLLAGLFSHFIMITKADSKRSS